MSEYVVSARKYRPVLFDDVLGQSHITKTLKNALRSGQIGHSFLFCGPRGVGKTTTARILAKVLNCTNRTEDFEPCNTCQSCESFNDNASFNIQELDAASHNSVDDIRSLVEQVRFAPQEGQYKIYIIDEVHMLSNQAFNAFLKTLEEPPPYAIFILATTEKHKIIPTILSRCQIFDFKRVPVNIMVDHLAEISRKENISAETEGLHIIAQKADGALRDALSMYDRIVSFSNSELSYANVIDSLNILDYDTFFQFTDALLSHDRTSVLTMFDKILTKGFDGDQFILGLAEHIRNLLVAKNQATARLVEVPETIQNRYIEQAQNAQVSFLLNSLDISNKCDVGYGVARNKRLHVELALLKMTYLGFGGGKQAMPVIEEKKTPELSKGSAALTATAKETVSAAVEDNLDENTNANRQSQGLSPNPEIIEEESPRTEENVLEENTEDENQAKNLATEVVNEPVEVEMPAQVLEISATNPSPTKTQRTSVPSKHGGFSLNQVTDQVKEEDDLAEEDIDEGELVDLNQDEITAAWISLAKEFEEKQPTLSLAISTTRAVVNGARMRLEIQGSINKDLIEKQQVMLINRVKKACDVKRIIVEYDVKEVDKTVERSLTKQEQLELLVKEHPHVKDLTDRFDLEIDYSQ